PFDPGHRTWPRILIWRSRAHLMFAARQQMSQQTENLRILEQLAEAFNQHDLDKIMSFFSDDCSLDMPRGPDPWGTRYIGKAAVRKGLQSRFEMLPDVHYADLRHFATESMGVSEWLVTGTLRSGTAVKVRGC